jgi:hypothetical protein
MGYTFESAIADVIDNSISADCSFVQLFFPTNPLEVSICILDDGWGMSENELFDAMRYGSTASENQRSEVDLGRFGLGLKAASLSQCRRLTVVSKRKDTNLSAFQWDYNFIKEQKEWVIKQFDISEIEKLPNVECLQNLSSGTLVIWEDFDFMEKSSGSIYNTLCDYKEKVSEYISLIFHRFITSNKVSFKLNYYNIEAKDPFLENHKKTTIKKEIDLVLPDSNGIERHIKIQPYILPFIKDLSEKDIQKIGGVESIKMRQGFYIYRNNRLIIWGTWFGRKKEELTKNARIRVDIPNSLDDIWEIDIKKQNATIPRRILNQLTAKVNEVMDNAVRQQTHRGRKSKVDEDTEYIWNRLEGRSKNFYYEINREHKLFQMVKKNVSEDALRYFELFLEEIEKNIPFQQMYIDQSRNAIDDKISTERDNDIFIKACMMIDLSLKFGNTPANAIDIIMKSEPFCKFDNLRIRLQKHYKL